MTIEKVTLATAGAYIAQLKSEYEQRHKYLIAGKLDEGFQAIGRLITDQKAFDLLKMSRTTQANTVSGIQNNANYDDAMKLKLTANAKLSYLRQAIAAVKSISDTAAAKQIAKAVATLSADLSGIVQDYTSGMATHPESKDAAFIASARTMMNDIRSMTYVLQPKLIKANIFYSVDINKAKKLLDTISAALKAAV